MTEGESYPPFFRVFVLVLPSWVPQILSVSDVPTVSKDRCRGEELSDSRRMWYTSSCRKAFLGFPPPAHRQPSLV